MQTVTTGRCEEFYSHVKREHWKKPCSPKKLPAFMLMLWRGLCSPAEPYLRKAAAPAKVVYCCLWLPGSAESWYLMAETRGCRLLQSSDQIMLLTCIVLPSHKEGAFVSAPISLPFSLFGLIFQRGQPLTDLRCSQWPFTWAELHVLQTVCTSLSSTAACLQVHDFPWH